MVLLHFQTTHSKPSQSIFDSKMNPNGAISKLLKDLKIEFELKEEQKFIIKAIINREDFFFCFTHVHFRIKYRPRGFATSCLKVMWHDLFLKMAVDLVRFGSAHLDVWKWSKSMECDGVFAVYIERKAMFIHPFSDFSVTTRNVRLGITIGVRLPFQCKGTDAKTVF